MRGRGLWVGVGAAGVLLAGQAALAAPAATAAAAAASPDPVCSGGSCSITYSTAGTGQTLTVPNGVSSLSVRLDGGVGGTNYDSDVNGGDGAEVTATLAVVSGEVLGVDVGGAGAGG